MKAKRVLSLIMMTVMLMSCLSVYASSTQGTTTATAPTEDYFKWSQDVAANQTFSVNLDDIFATGETYRISFNVKPSVVDATANAVIFNVNLTGGNATNNRFVKVYRASSTAAELCAIGPGSNGWNNLGYITGYPDALAQNGCDVEMLWNTDTGMITTTVDITGTQYTTLPKTFTWDFGKVAEGGSYGKLDFTAGTNSVEVKSLSIRKANKTRDVLTSDSYTTKGSDDYMLVDLDDIFKTGDTYKISFNAKSTDTSVMGPLYVAMGGRAFKKLNNALVYLYDSENKTSFNALVGDSWKDNITAFRGALATTGANVEMVWNTATGKVDVDLYLPWNITFPYSVSYSDKRHFSQQWNAGVIGEGQKYGKLLIGSPTRFSSKGTNVEVRDMVIRNVTQNPTGKYELASYNAPKSSYKMINLDEIIKTGNKYELKWNMKPAAVDTTVQGIGTTVDIIDCDSQLTTSMNNTSNQNHRGLLWLYTQSNGFHGQGLADYAKIGALTNCKDAILTNGVDVKLLWDTETGHVYVKTNFGGALTKTFEWNPGKITGRYGYLIIGSEASATSLSNLSIKQVANIEAPVLTPQDIKIYANNVEQSATNADTSVNKVTVNFNQAMFDADMVANNIYVVEKNGTPENKLAANLAYANGICTLTLNDALVPGKTYTVVVKQVRNAVERWTTQAYTKDFTVISSGVHADITGIVQNGETVTAFSELAAGNATAKISYTKDSTATAPSAVNVIVAYYKDKCLVNVQQLPQTTDLDKTSNNFDVEFSVPATDTFDKISVMSWGDFDKIVPLSKAVTFENN